MRLVGRWGLMALQDSVAEEKEDRSTQQAYSGISSQSSPIWVA